MANFMNRLANFMGLNEEDDEENSYYDEEEEPVRRGSRDRSTQRDRDEREDRTDRYDRYDDYDRYDRAERNDRSERRDRAESRANGRSDAAEISPRNTYTPNSARRTSSKSSAPAQDSYPVANGMKMIVYHPVTYEDTQHIIDNVKNRKPVIVNMEDLEVETAQRILDFLSGAIYALNGTMSKISRGIFIVAPNNCDVIGNEDGEEEYDA